MRNFEKELMITQEKYKKFVERTQKIIRGLNAEFELIYDYLGIDFVPMTDEDSYKNK